MDFDAHYQTDHLLERWMGNPLIEALPRLQDEDEITKQVVNLPPFVRAEKLDQPPRLRGADVNLLDELFIPPNITADLACTLDDLIRNGYAARKPQDPKVTAEIYDAKTCLEAQEIHQATFDSVVFLEGLSGLGKTRLIRTILGRLPQIINHKSYQGKDFHLCQVLSLSIDAPIGGSLQGLMYSLLVAFDDAVGISGTPMSLVFQYQGKSVDTMLVGFCRAAMTYRLGILHIDDFQRVAESNSGSLKVLHFIIRLVNTIRCPLVLSGTKETLKFLTPSAPNSKKKHDQPDFEASRRIFSGGHFKLTRARSHSDSFFRILVKTMLRYQWTDSMMPLSEDVYERLYWECCGITSVLLFLHKNAQIRALKARRTVTLDDYTTVNETMFSRLAPALDALRVISGKSVEAAEAEFEDRIPQANRDAGSLTAQSSPLDATDAFLSLAS